MFLTKLKFHKSKSKKPRRVNFAIAKSAAVAVIAAATLLFIVSPPLVAAADPTVLLIGPMRLVRTNDQLAVEVQMDSAGKQINAAELYIQYPSDRLKVIRIGREQSIWTVWAEDPSWEAASGTVQLKGGRPKGIIASGATVATIYFTVLKSGSFDISLQTPASKVFYHDGRGTSEELPPATLSVDVADPLVGGLILRSATHPTIDAWSREGSIDVNWDVESNTLFSYNLSEDRTAVPDEIPEKLTSRVLYTGLSDGVYYFTIRSKSGTESWTDATQRRFLLDQTPPEAFTIDTIQTEAVPGQTLLSWLAVDRTAGVENYRLLVAGRDQGLVTSPLVLKPEWSDQNLEIIATDAAGNRQTSRLAGQAAAISPIMLTAAVVAGAIVLGGLIFIRTRTRRRISSSA